MRSLRFGFQIHGCSFGNFAGGEGRGGSVPERLNRVCRCALQNTRYCTYSIYTSKLDKISNKTYLCQRVTKQYNFWKIIYEICRHFRNSRRKHYEHVISTRGTSSSHEHAIEYTTRGTTDVVVTLQIKAMLFRF